MGDSDHSKQTALVGNQALPSNAEVQKVIRDHVLTLEPKLRNLNRYVCGLSLSL